jgi:hypothetical protein
MLMEKCRYVVETKAKEATYARYARYKNYSKNVLCNEIIITRVPRE